MKLTSQIKVDRNSKDKTVAIKKAVGVLKKGGVVAIFPEGTRSADGKLKKAYSGVAKIALDASVSVMPVGIKGTYSIMSRFDKRPKFIKECVINFGNLLSFSKYSTINYVNKDLYRKITDDTIMPKIASLSEQIYEPK